MESKLQKIQSELKVPKGQTNSFGGYKYRSTEDIVEALKPILNKHKVTLVLSDELVNIGDRYYIKATANLHDSEGFNSQTHGYAREEESKKGMDGSQITGAASSYARKYALNGLFLIDDTKDSDATNDGSEAPKAATAARIQPKQLKDISDVLTAAGVAKEDQMKTLANLTMKADLNVREISFLEGAKILDDLMAATPETIKNLSKSEPF